MHRIFLFMLIWLTVFSAMPPTVESSENDMAAFAQAFFVSLKQGDTETILDLCIDPLLTEKRDLLENNRQYPDFLRQAYQHATMVVNEIDRVDDAEGTVDVEFRFPEGPPLKTRFLLKRQNGAWRLASEEGLN